MTISEIINWIRRKDNSSIIIFAFLLSLTSVFFLANKGNIFTRFVNDFSADYYYMLFFIFSVLGIGSALFFSIEHRFRYRYIVEKVIFLFLPVEIIFFYGLQKLNNLSPFFGAASAAYILILSILLSYKYISKNKGVKKYENPDDNQLKNVMVKRHWIIIIISLVMLINFFFGFYHLGKMAIVDEPLWTFDRIPNFWKDVGEGDWYGSRVSDKPGLTTALISGTGLLFEKYPNQFKNIVWIENSYNINAPKMEKFNIIFRLPILAFEVIMLPFFYFLINRLAGKISALFSTIFIGLSPIIIGNSRIINPDGLLWIFTTISIISYFIYYKKFDRKYIFLSAFFLGMGLLTKYVANILYLFFFCLIFIEYIFNYHRKYYNTAFHDYLKKTVLDYVLLIAVSLAVIYVFYPAVWGKPSRVLIATIYSQAFEPIWPLFATFFSLIAAEIILLKSRITDFFVRNILIKARKVICLLISGIFLFSIFVVLYNVYSNMKIFKFEDILASPKSAYSLTGATGIFFANFYPLLFGISAIALFSIIFFLIKEMLSRNFDEENYIYVCYFIIFILIYYAGSVFSHVASIIRYQIILYPITFIIAGVSLSHFMEWGISKIKKYKNLTINFSFLLLIAFLSTSLYRIKPFYMGYASTLLPRAHFLDIKDMGEGSYEAANYLNSLPHAGNLNIWTDKQGVCVFFIGQCHTTISLPFFTSNKIDYFVLSSGRKNRTIKMTTYEPIKKSYFSDNAIYKLEIGGRPNNYVKVISAKILDVAE